MEFQKILTKNMYFFLNKEKINSIVVVITSVGSSSAPGGIATMLIALNASGLPTKDLPMLFSVDWIL